jgi:hypothetical protein
VRNVCTACHLLWQGVQWRAHLPDLSSYDYPLWGYLNGKVFMSKPRTIEEPKQRTKEKIPTISQQMTHHVMKNLQGRLEQCLINGGGHLSDVLFNI